MQQPLLRPKVFMKNLLKRFKILWWSIATGKFGAHMNIALQEDGPVTIWLDSKIKAMNMENRELGKIFLSVLSLMLPKKC